MSATSILVQPLQLASRPQLYKPRPRVVLSHAPQAPPTVPLITRESLATRFRQNWAAKHPSDSVSVSTTQVDDSLTSLNWLQNLNIMNMATPTPPDSPEPALKHAGVTGNLGDMQVDPNAVLNMVSVPVLRRDADSPGEVQLSPLSYKLTPGLDAAPPSVDKVDYKSNPYVKPPYSYATLICMAMRESNKNKITLSGIYTWITDNFMYYRVADPSWQNSIRHNLSLNKCFQKVPRQKDEPGKGGFWRINPEYSDMFVNGIFKKRRSTGRETITSPPLKKVKHESEADLAAASLTDAGLGTPEVQAHMPEHNALLHLEQADDTTEMLRGDFNWNAILYQDIEVGGVRIKTEDIIDEHNLPSPVDDSINMPLSPPASDSNSDIALEDLLNSADMTAGAPPFDDPLDLTIQGAGIKPPDWWSESMNKDLMQRMLMSPEHEPSAELHTPLGPSPTHEIEQEEFSHPWAESRAELDEAIASFDLDLQNLFDEDLTGGSMLDS